MVKDITDSLPSGFSCTVGDSYSSSSPVEYALHKQTEEALRESEARLKLALEAARLGTWEWRMLTGEVIWSRECEAVFGLSPGSFKGTYEAFARLVHSEDKESMTRSLQEAMQDTGEWEMDYRAVHPDGSIRWVVSTGKFVYNESRQAVRMLGVLRDITERKQAEDALRRMNETLEIRVAERTAELARANTQLQQELLERQRAQQALQQQQSLLSGIIEGTTDLIAAMDMNFRYTAFNSAYKAEFLKIFGREIEIGTSMIEALVHLPEEQAKAVDIWGRALAGEEFTVIQEFGDTARERNYYEITYSSIRDENGQRIGASHIVKDVSDRKQSELEITQSRDLKEAIFNESADAIFLVDPETLLTLDCNRRAVELFEAKSKDELLNGANHTLQRQPFTPEELAAIAQEINTGDVWSRELEYVTKKGNLFWGNLAIKQINVVGKAMHLARVTDITQHKQAEAQIKASLKEKEVLLKEIHHRVKNNLQIVDSLLQMQSRRTQDRQAIEILRDSRNRIASIALVHEKLYRSADLGNINFSQYIPDLIVHLFDSYNIGSKNIILHINLDDISLDIGTAMPCGLIVNELVSNALKYAFPDNRQGEIHVQFFAKSDRTMMVIVRDNGIGIPDDFDIETSSSLGLTLVQGLVEQLEGTLECERAGGTEFRITFPGGRT